MAGTLAIQNLYKSFAFEGRSNRILEGISLEVTAGGLLTIVGPSGCGKSTLLRCIAGFERPDSGRTLVDGQPVQGPGRDRMMVFQEFEQLFPWLTVLQNVSQALKISRAAAAAATRTALAGEYLQRVGLADYAAFFPHQLSGGMKQRVAIARALAVRPKILLMDEPFGSLDALTRSDLQNELIRIWEETGVTILFVTHSIEEAILLSDTIMVLDSHPGRLKALVENVLPRPRTPELAGFSALWRQIRDQLGSTQNRAAQPRPRRLTIFEDEQLGEPVS